MNESEKQLTDISSRLQAIEERNARVELDKLWEISRTRRVCILVLTYAVMCITFLSLGVEKPWQNAFIPTLGFFLSNLTLPIIRDYWKNH